MTNNFQIKSLHDTEFDKLFILTDSELEKQAALRMRVDKKPGFPCRVSLEDAEIGEEVILLPYQHHKTNSPYQSSGPIFVRANAKSARLDVNEVPSMLNHRLLSLRSFDSNGMMKEALVTEGSNVREALDKIFDTVEISYVHIHNAKPGCYNCIAERA